MKQVGKKVGAEDPNYLQWLLVGVLVLAVSQIVHLAIVLWLTSGSLFSLETGQFGDLFGGFNGFVSSVGLAAVAVQLFMQQKSLSLQREEMALQREEMAGQREELRLQREASERAQKYRVEPIVLVGKGGLGRSHRSNGSIGYDVRMHNVSGFPCFGLEAEAWFLSPAGEVESLAVAPERESVLMPGAESRIFRFNVDPSMCVWIGFRVRYRNVAGGTFCVYSAADRNATTASRVWIESEVDMAEGVSGAVGARLGRLGI